MDFILRILFSGLIAFVPSEDGKEVTVLLLNANHYHTSDGAALQSHMPLLLAKGGGCTGDCPTIDPAIASFIYADKTPTVATDSLQLAVSGGGAWQLSGSELSVRKGSSTAADLSPLVIRNNVRGTVNGQPQLVPTNATEREDFSWVPNLKQVCANGCTLNPAVLATQPPSGLIAARFRLRSGTVFTYSVARVGANVTPVNFKRLDGTGSASSYSQAVATWVAADIAITGSNVEIVEEKFAGGAGRSMMLTPDANDRIEIAVLNLPPFIPPASPANDDPQVGKHFEAYYDLATNPPARETRLVPRPGAAANATYPQVDWSLVHPQNVLYSELLNKLRLDVGRSVYDRTLCPPTQNPLP